MAIPEKEKSLLKRENHAMYYSSEYMSWRAMRSRCLDPRDKKFSYYGGSGIKICERWRKSFSNFFEDMGVKPSRKHTLDRRDGKKDYTPDNCRWATRSEQIKNRPPMSLQTRTKIAFAKRQFNEEQLLKIKEMIGNGIAQTKIAAMFGVSQTAISKIKLGKIYFV
jgi:hypothetical protein